MSTVAVIPARGGSKRLPRKNILDLAGKPMLAYAIETAHASRLFDQVCVSTEDADIARVAREFGAAVIERPDSIAGDRSTVAQVCLHALEALPSIDVFCCIYATAVLLKPETLQASHALLEAEPKADYVMGVSRYEHPPVQALKADEAGYLTYMWPEWRGVQSQFQPDLVVSNGTFYWGRRQPFLADRTFYGSRLRGAVVPDDQVSDIDTEADFRKVFDLISGVEGRLK
ncbi:cytidylyltransferase domain-containing protein [Methyloversatilis discipulorum]|jgi:pseudaminic acid cytidylyltransferase|uniref:acylneuraminate cytidylyltransferase family protein n=1 Tax=Methyloversatilis discipulorum TaxID=1119528 RepID=UPI00035CF776|nr:acylneuraminate cytidylyltransferase family protein [Methyloversatilis discipulorum]